VYSFYKLRLLRIASCTVPACNAARICCPACHPVRSPARTPGEELLNFAATKCYKKDGPEFAFCERGQRFCIWYILVLTWYWPGNAGRCWSIFRKDVNSWLRAAGPSDVSEVLGQAPVLVTACHRKSDSQSLQSLQSHPWKIKIKMSFSVRGSLQKCRRWSSSKTPTCQLFVTLTSWPNCLGAQLRGVRKGCMAVLSIHFNLNTKLYQTIKNPYIQALQLL